MKKKVVMACVVSVFPQLAWSAPDAPETWYVGVAVGHSYVVDPSGVVLSVNGASRTRFTDKEDGEDTAYKVFAGYRLNPYIGAEVSWVDLGKASGRRVAVPPAAGSIVGTMESSAAAFDLVVTLPVQAVALFVKGGIFRSKTKARFSASGFSINGDARRTQTETNAKFGAGAQYAFSKTSAVRLEWERYRNVGDARTGEADVELVSVGLLYQF